MKTSYKLSYNSWGFKEKLAATKVILGGNYTMGKYVEQFEEQFARKMKTKYAVMVNSGSSANLLAIASLVYSGNLKRGDEILVPAVSWSTTYSPLIQYGLKPIFMDCDIDSFNSSPKNILKLSSNTKAVFAVNLLGLPADLQDWREYCKRNNLILIEDNCESLGATENDQQAGTFGLIGTYSFFFSHHLQTMEGGMIVTNSYELYNILKSVRAHGWIRKIDTRFLEKENSLIISSGETYKEWVDSRNGFNENFSFVLPGYCVRPVEISGAVGIEQLKKLDDFVEKRRKNAEIFQNEFYKYNIQKEKINQKSSWYSFGIVFNYANPFHVYLQLKQHGIDCRPIVAGNILMHPLSNYFDQNAKQITEDVPNANKLHSNGIFLGNYPKNLSKELQITSKILKGII